MKKSSIFFLPLLSSLGFYSPVGFSQTYEEEIGHKIVTNTGLNYQNSSEKKSEDKVFENLESVIELLTKYEPSFMKSEEKLANFIRNNHDKNSKDLLRALVGNITLQALEKYANIDVKSIRNTINDYTYYPLFDGKNGSYIKLSTSFRNIPHRCQIPNLYEANYFENLDCNTIRIQNQFGSLERNRTQIALSININF